MINWLEIVLIIAGILSVIFILWVSVMSLIVYRVLNFLRSEAPFDVIIKGEKNDQK